MLSGANRNVVAVAYDGVCTFELGIVVEIFGLARPELDVDWYRFQICSVDRGPLRATGGIRIQAGCGIEAIRRAKTVVIPGWRDAHEKPPAALIRALRAAHDRGARLVSICSGVFVLAATGLLNGRRATTHWRYAEMLGAMYPEIQVDPQVLYVDEGSILTSAGSAAGIDLCLHIVRRDYGAEIANKVARRLVMPPHRDGGQAQFIEEALPDESSAGLAPLLDWIKTHLREDLAVDDLARRAAMSSRTFARRFVEQTGTSPHQWIMHQRLLAAQRRLERTEESVDRVAEAVGLQTAATLRQQFQRSLGTTPTAYRRRFST